MSKLLPVETALERILDGVEPIAPETVALADAHNRILAEDLIAQRTQPPFPASAMDGYAVRGADVKDVPCKLNLIGESAAGHGFSGSVSAGETVRIFTGAPVPDGADTIVIQENVSATGNTILVREAAASGQYLRPAGLDFMHGDLGIHSGQPLDAAAISLAASMNHPRVSVRRKPRVAVIASGDELVPPGTKPGPDQIIASNSFGVAGIIRDAGGEPVDLGIAADSLEAVEEKLAQADGCDIVVTLGGASVGDHDLIQEALTTRGVVLDFWALAMKPGKPVMFGKRVRGTNTTRYIGLPGNPVSSLVCSLIFLAPLIQRLLGRHATLEQAPARLDIALPASGPRKEYMRATSRYENGERFVTPYDNQDSSILSLLARADCLLIRPANSAAAATGSSCEIMPL